MENWYWVAFGCLFTFGFMAIGHYLPRAKEIEWDQNRMLISAGELLGRYIYGVGVIFIGFGLTQFGQNDHLPPLADLSIIIAIAGLTTLACYGWDRLIKWLRRIRKYEAIDDER